MGASNGIITNHKGGTLSIYLASNGAVGTYLPVSKSQVALSTDSIEFIPNSNGLFARINVIAGVTGVIMLERDGDVLPYIINLAQHKDDLTTPGGANVNIPYHAGHKYRFKVVVALSA